MKTESIGTDKPAAATGKAARRTDKTPETKATQPKKSGAEMPDTQEAWRGFKPGLWQRDINVRWFIQQNYKPYDGDGKFLQPPTERTQRVWKKLQEMFIEERKK